MVDIASIQEEIINNLENRKEIYALLFKLSLALIKEGENIISKEFINKINDHFKSIKEDLNPCQIVFISEVILNLILHYSDEEDNEINNLKDNYEKLFNDNLERDEILKKILETAKNLKEENSNVEDLILHIIIYFLNNFESLKLKQDWDKLDLYLENFEINEAIQKRLEQFLEDNNNIAEYFEEIELKANVINDSKILKEIYDYIKFKSIKKIKIEKIKYDGDKERVNNDSGRDADYTVNENSEKKSTGSSTDNSLAQYKEIIKKIMNKSNKFIMKLDTDGNPLFLYEENKITDSFELEYQKKYRATNVDEKNFVKYLEFVNKVIKYIKEMKNEIKYNTNICLELTITNKIQSQETIEEMSKRKRNIEKNLCNVRCLSYIIDKKNNSEGGDDKFKDENVLVYGLDGQVPGFIYLVNELCNDDYINDKDKVYIS